MIRDLKDFHPHQLLAFRRKLAELVQQQTDKQLTRELIEQAVVESIPELADATVEDDDFHSLISEISAEYSRNGALD